MYKNVNLFDQSYDGHIPIELKILVSLRILARGNCADDISKFSDIGESSVLHICSGISFDRWYKMTHSAHFLFVPTSSNCHSR